VASSDSDRRPHSHPRPHRPHRPRIGVSTYLEVASWGVWQRPAAIVPGVYLDAVVGSGGVPVLLPPVGTDASVLDVLDGLLLVGGADLDPSTYGAEPHPLTTGTRPDRDQHESVLLGGALDRDLPVLGVCRGSQMVVAALGGSLHQHVPEIVGHDGHRPEPAVFGTTTVHTREGSLAAQILGPESKVPCYHHQGLATVEPPLAPTAWSEDGLVEAVELATGGWLLGVQWHPEENPDDLRLFEAHVAEAARRAESHR
jgi:gamma-glutamyl-gamma-aminobutyrate hydrolase PuuD